jgi:hypothetical protein
MTDKLLSEAEDAYVAFSDYRYAMHDAPLEFPHIAFAKLEEAMRKLGDAIDDAIADAMLNKQDVPDNTPVYLSKAGFVSEMKEQSK